MNTIITHPNFDYLWKEIANDKGLNHTKVDFSVFSDKWPNIFIERAKNTLEHKEVTYIWDFSRIEDLFTNYTIIRWILDYYVSKLRIIMPYFPVWTMERIDTKWQIATAKYFADIFSQIPSGREGKTSIHIFDIHALVERFLFDSNKVNVEMHTTMNLLKNHIEWKSIVFPDDGAYKRFWKDFKDYDTIVCSKVREWDKRIITVKE
jgi:phosphoribosylpyrophosphate synthetase